MSNELRDAFDSVKADEILKQKTMAAICKKTNGFQERRTHGMRRLVSTLACLALVLVGAYWLYFVPTVEVSVDINPSIELGLNRFDRVVSVTAYNDDGEMLKDSLDVHFLTFQQAVDRILEEEKIRSLLAKDELLSIGVIGERNTQASRLINEARECAASTENVVCYHAEKEELVQAHEEGFSYGKYRAFLALREADPSITKEQAKTMTMRQLKDRIEEITGEPYLPSGSGYHGGAEESTLLDENDDTEESNGCEGENNSGANSRANGNGSGSGNGNGNGNGSDRGNGNGNGNGNGDGSGNSSRHGK